MTHPLTSADEAAVQALYEDCCYIYDTARREVTIPRSDGRRQKYAAVRFKQQMDKAHREGRLVAAVTATVARPTDGFSHLEAAQRPDLLLETFVLDDSKPYHHLFDAHTVQTARQRMDEYARRNPPAAAPS
ncbi:hypothetical protein [Kineococcus sp. SYSU DK018]|uniref:hypothetical protein n=1 Tax=Kineococcus sp. SYSU DK018 TaxID=3383139 RepID=UPI003D7E65D1